MSKQVTQFHTKPRDEKEQIAKRELGLPGREYQKTLKEAITKREQQSYLIDKANKKIEDLAEYYVPRLYNILTVKEGRDPFHARRIILTDLVYTPDVPVWKEDTVKKWIPSAAKDQKRSKAGQISAEVKRADRMAKRAEVVNTIVERIESSPADNRKTILKDTLMEIVGKPTRDTMLVDVNISKDQHEEFVKVFAASNSRGYTIHLRNTEIIGLDPINW